MSQEQKISNELPTKLQVKNANFDAAAVEAIPGLQLKPSSSSKKKLKLRLTSHPQSNSHQLRLISAHINL